MAKVWNRGTLLRTLALLHGTSAAVAPRDGCLLQRAASLTGAPQAALLSGEPATSESWSADYIQDGNGTTQPKKVADVAEGSSWYDYLHDENGTASSNGAATPVDTAAAMPGASEVKSEEAVESSWHDYLHDGNGTSSTSETATTGSASSSGALSSRISNKVPSEHAASASQPKKAEAAAEESSWYDYLHDENGTASSSGAPTTGYTSDNRSWPARVPYNDAVTVGLDAYNRLTSGTEATTTLPTVQAVEGASKPDTAAETSWHDYLHDDQNVEVTAPPEATTTTTAEPHDEATVDETAGDMQLFQLHLTQRLADINTGPCGPIHRFVENLRSSLAELAGLPAESLWLLDVRGTVEDLPYFSAGKSTGAELLQHDGRSDRTSEAAEAVKAPRYSEHGCECRKEWSAGDEGNDCQDYCCDFGFGQAWCFHMDSGCAGRTWGVCKPEMTSKTAMLDITQRKSVVDFEAPRNHGARALEIWRRELQEDGRFNTGGCGDTFQGAELLTSQETARLRSRREHAETHREHH